LYSHILFYITKYNVFAFVPAPANNVAIEAESIVTMKLPCGVEG
jgi:hypothetical protein